MKKEELEKLSIGLDSLMNKPLPGFFSFCILNAKKQIQDYLDSKTVDDFVLKKNKTTLSYLMELHNVTPSELALLISILDLD